MEIKKVLVMKLPTKSTEPFITIDHGNTNTSLILHNCGKSKEISFDQYVEDSHLNSLPGIFSRVGSDDIRFPKQLLNVKSYLVNNIFFDMNVHYLESIGADRLISAYFVFKNKIRKNSDKYLIIDAGTFTTIDVVSKDGFKGGYIFPGETTYLKSFSEGHDLPLFSKVLSRPSQELPQSTEEAIKQSYHLFMKSILREIMMSNNIDKVILTGGNTMNLGLYLEKYISSKEIMPNLVHESLKFLFENNIKKATGEVIQ